MSLLPEYFYCEGCKAWTTVDDARPTEPGFECGECGDTYECGECGSLIERDGACTDKTCAGSR